MTILSGEDKRVVLYVQRAGHSSILGLITLASTAPDRASLLYNTKGRTFTQKVDFRGRKTSEKNKNKNSVQSEQF